MELWSEPYNPTVFLNRLKARSVSSKEYLLIHIAYLDNQMEKFLRKKNHLQNLQTIQIDSFVDKLIYFEKNASSLFRYRPQEFLQFGGPFETYVESITSAVRRMRNAIMHFRGVKRSHQRAAKHDILGKLEHLIELENKHSLIEDE